MADAANNAPNPEYLNLKVKSQDGEEVFFKIKRTTQFRKLMEAYCQRQTVSMNNVRFLFDGEKIKSHLNSKNKNPDDLLLGRFRKPDKKRWRGN